MKTTELKPFPSKIYVIGAGGGASYLLPYLIKTTQLQPEFFVVDADILEERNLDRQMFRPADLGRYKAEALVDKVLENEPNANIRAINRWFNSGFEVEEDSLIISCVDNHPARKAILEVADRMCCDVIMGGNEYTDVEALFYTSEWRGTSKDPRVRFPELLTDTADDPTRPEGCQGEATVKNPQLALANFGAAYLIGRLLWFWYQKAPSLFGNQDAEPKFPIRECGTFSRLITETAEDYL